jgi:hypothetical protein
LQRIARAEVRPAAFSARLAAPRPQVGPARADLLRLARRLAGPEPVDPRGLALTRRLLSDGAGPLHWGASPADLTAHAREALAALEPRRDSLGEAVAS